MSTLFKFVFNYADMAIILIILSMTFSDDYGSLAYPMERGFDLVEGQANSKPQLRYLGLSRTNFSPSSIDIQINRNFIYVKFHPFDSEMMGFALYKLSKYSFSNYTIKTITFENVTKTLSHNEDVDVVLYSNCANCSDLLDTISIEMHTFICNNNNFTEDGSFSSKIRIVGLQNKIIEAPTYNFSGYFKAIDENSGEANEGGYWFTITVPNGTFVIVTISEPRTDVCDSTNKLLVYQTYSDGRKNSTEDEVVINGTVLKLDFLSQLVVQVNMEAGELHREHLLILEFISFSLGALSELALLFILITMVLIKNWYKKRLCSIQLCIATAGEIFFFLTKNVGIGHAGYVIFYYFMLVQFSWMAIIGYIQYMKFIRIFRTSKLGVFKPMLFGWLLPLIIISAIVLFHLECFKCNLCSKNGSIFIYFVLFPVSVVIVCNLIIYLFVVVNISRDTSHMTPEVKIARSRAIIMLPFILGIYWIFALVIMAPWPWISLVGSYLFHIIAPSQGLIVFVFLVILDKNTMKKLWNYVPKQVKIYSSNTVK